jgi:hypothetical protein
MLHELCCHNKVVALTTELARKDGLLLATSSLLCITGADKNNEAKGM